MSACCGHSQSFDGLSADYKRRLWAVIIINALGFVIEMTAGHMARSQALQADALDFFADAVTYGISLAVIGASLRVRTTAAAVKGISLLLMGIWVFASTIYRVFYLGVPEAPVMGIIGFLALVANLVSVWLLMNYKDGDANVRSVWLCSRNDAIGNVVVMIAALGVWGTTTAWPDLIVAGIMAGLFLTSAVQILKHSWREWKAGKPIDLAYHGHDHSHDGGHEGGGHGQHAHAGCGHDHDHAPKAVSSCCGGHGHDHDHKYQHGKEHPQHAH